MIDPPQRRLLVINERQSLEVPFSQQITIGRDVINALALLDREVSRSHAILYCREAEDGPPQLMVRDLDSLNGVYLNGERVKEAVLKPGDELILGTTIVLLSPDSDSDLEECLSAKGKRLLRGIQAPKPFRPTEISSFTLEELGELADREFANLENSAIWSPKNASVMMQAVVRMSEAQTEDNFFRAALEAARDLVQADRGVVMALEPDGKSLSIRSLLSEDPGEAIVITHNVMRILIKGAKAFFSSDVASDDRLTDFADKPKESLPHTLAAIPFQRGGKPVGFLYLDSRNPRFSYDQWALILLSLLMRPCACLVEIKGFLPNPQ